MIDNPGKDLGGAAGRLKVRRYGLVCDSGYSILQVLSQIYEKNQSKLQSRTSGPKFGVWIGKAEETQNKHWKQLFCPGSLCTECDYEQSHLENQLVWFRELSLCTVFEIYVYKLFVFSDQDIRVHKHKERLSCLFIVLQIQLL